MGLYEKLDSDSSEDISDSENGTVFHLQPTPPWKSRYVLPLAFAFSTLGFLTAAGMLALYWQLVASFNELSSQSSPEIHQESSHEVSSDLILDCGSSLGEAMARGCTLDIMADAWLPQACYYADAAEEAMSPDTRLAHYGGAGPFEWLSGHQSHQAYTLKNL
jgi:hypothetical protein